MEKFSLFTFSFFSGSVFDSGSSGFSVFNSRASFLNLLIVSFSNKESLTSLIVLLFRLALLLTGALISSVFFYN
jgi:hypothetical protein